MSKYDREPRVLFFDIETTPFVGYTWGKWQQNVIKFDEYWHLLCFAYKWQGEDEVHVVGQDDFPREYKRNRKDDRRVAKELWKLFDEADVLVGHNGDQFDIKKVHARFAIHGMGRPAPSLTVDTKKVASRNFNFGSNSLNDLGDMLGLGQKLTHTGFDLWLGCMAGNPESWEMMKAYNQQDVILLEQVYDKFLMEGWIDNHPNMALISGRLNNCPKCLAPANRQMRRGFRTTTAYRYQQYQCQECGSYHRVRVAERDSRPKYA